MQRVPIPLITHTRNKGLIIMTSDVFLVADIGGTNSRLALSKESSLQKDSIKRVKNADYANFEDILTAYLKSHKHQNIKGICVALAGPVTDTQGHMTNLNWTLTKTNLEKITNAHAVIINDLQAQGYALDLLEENDIQRIYGSGKTYDGKPKLVCGIGTGYNIAQVHYVKGDIYVPPAEAGHASLPGQNMRQREVIDALLKAQGFVSIEDILSGKGLARLGNMLRQQSDLTSQAIIIEATQSKKKTDIVSLFAEFAGSIIGDSALSIVPKGGIYLTGGMARAIAPFFSAQDFGAAFCDKGRFSDFMESFSIFLVLDDFAALKGGVKCLRQRPW